MCGSTRKKVMIIKRKLVMAGALTILAGFVAVLISNNARAAAKVRDGSSPLPLNLMGRPGG